MHKFSHTHIEHHKDGSATVHHVHHEGPHKDVKHAVGNLDEMHDSLEDHLGQPNPGEGQDVNNEPMQPQMPPQPGA